MKKADKARQKRLQVKRTKRNQSRKGKTYNPNKFAPQDQNQPKEVLIL